MRPLLLLLLRAGLLLGLLVAVAACPASGGGPRGTTPPSPAGPTVALLDGAADLDGQPVGPLAAGQRATIAIVFASWCGACRDEIVVLDELRATHPDVRLLGVNYRAHEEYDGRGDAAAVRAFVATHAPWLRVVPADEAMWGQLGRPPKVPTLYVFDRTGALARTFDRRHDPLPTRADLEAALAALP
ncbi:MAG: TlpA family protein disulfide reductase [Kofleriaceae bacterium]|nr:TlpA family protein disulfide reductase [Kofleriaceae bacterium]MCL4227407.1 TlpA family protein disulfide reductase [Myxococcales bacterium]